MMSDMKAVIGLCASRRASYPVCILSSHRDPGVVPTGLPRSVPVPVSNGRSPQLDRVRLSRHESGYRQLFALGPRGRRGRIRTLRPVGLHDPQNYECLKGSMLSFV
jgi:hypothetical protein